MGNIGEVKIRYLKFIYTVKRVLLILQNQVLKFTVSKRWLTVYILPAQRRTAPGQTPSTPRDRPCFLGAIRGIISDLDARPVLRSGLGCAGYAGPSKSLEEIRKGLDEDLKRRWRGGEE
jgi:hypothetical protein